MITLLNLHHPPPGLRGEYVGRPSPLGNPYSLHRESDRDYVLDLYQTWFDAKVAARDIPVMVELARLGAILHRTGNLYLACWCAPKRCHAETISKWLEENC